MTVVTIFPLKLTL